MDIFMTKTNTKTIICCIYFALVCCVKAAEPDKSAEFTQRAKQSVYTLTRSENGYSGAGWDFLLSEGQAAQFFLLGEEHGIAENPEFSGALFDALTDSGYEHFAIEISPPMAAVLEQAAAMGLPELKAFFRQPDGNTAFFGMLEEAKMLVQVMQAAGPRNNVLWGLDYEVLGDIYLIRQLAAREKPAGAQEAFANLEQNANEARKRFSQTRNPYDLFSFSASPTLVEAVINAWPDADPATSRILNTLLETYRINQLWVREKAWESNYWRAQLLRRNMLEYWQEYLHKTTKPRVFFKFGSSHMIRGRSMTGVYDLGNLLPELAAAEKGNSFQLLVLPGRTSKTAVFNPVNMNFEAGVPKDSYAKGLERLTDLASENQFTVFNLRPLRALARSKYSFLTPELIRVIHGFDALLIMNGSTPSRNLLEK
jgi:hypothetical protein